jgi:hypothetical protein
LEPPRNEISMGKDELQLKFNGWKHITPPKNCNHKYKKIIFGFFGTCGHYILDYFVHFKNITISFRLKLIYFEKNSNKKLWNLTYEV